MKREFRALSRLWRHYDRAPRAYLLCEDHEVAGADSSSSSTARDRWSGAASRPAWPVTRTWPDGSGSLSSTPWPNCTRSIPSRPGSPTSAVPTASWTASCAGGSSAGRRLHQCCSRARHRPGEDVSLRQARQAATKPPTIRTSVLHNDFKIDNCQFDPANPIAALGLRLGHGHDRRPASDLVPC